MDGFQNIPIEQKDNHQYWDFKIGHVVNYQTPVGSYDAHVDLDTANVWNKYVKPQLK